MGKRALVTCLADIGSSVMEYSPDSPVGCAAEELAQVKLADLRVATIGLDSLDNPGALLVAQEVPDLSVRVGEVDEEPVATDPDDDGQETLEYENPSPTSEATPAIKMDQAIGDDTGESRGQAADNVKEGITFAHFKSGVPCRPIELPLVAPSLQPQRYGPDSQKVDDAGEESSFEETEDNSQSGETTPVVNQTQSDQDDTPSYRDEGQEGAWAEFSADHSRRRLEDDVGDEEQQCDQRLSVQLVSPSSTNGWFRVKREQSLRNERRRSVRGLCLSQRRRQIPGSIDP